MYCIHNQSYKITQTRKVKCLYSSDLESECQNLNVRLRLCFQHYYVSFLNVFYTFLLPTSDFLAIPPPFPMIRGRCISQIFHFIVITHT